MLLSLNAEKNVFIYLSSQVSSSLAENKYYKLLLGLFNS